MLQELVKSVIDSFVAPRVAARRVMDTVQDFQGVAVIFGLSFTLSAIILILKASFSAEAAADIERAGGAISATLSWFIQSAVALAFFSAVVFGVGRLFGGVGTLLNVAAVIAWHSLITVVFSPFVSLSALTSGNSAALGQVFIGLFTLWLFVNFTAEAHRFKSVWKVAAITFGLMFIPVLLMTWASLNAM